MPCKTGGAGGWSELPGEYDESKVVFKLKRDWTGKVVKRKSRLVVLGCLQREGVDYEETFPHVAKCVSGWRSVHGTTSRNEYTGRLLFETGEKSIWFETSPAKLQPKIKTNLCDECWQTNCVIDMCDGAIGADKSYEVFQNRLIFTVWLNFNWLHIYHYKA